MFGTFQDLKNQIEDYIETFGPNAPCASFVYCEEDIDTEEEVTEEQKFEILSELGDGISTEKIYMEINQILDEIIEETI